MKPDDSYMIDHYSEPSRTMETPNAGTKRRNLNGSSVLHCFVKHFSCETARPTRSATTRTTTKEFSSKRWSLNGAMWLGMLTGPTGVGQVVYHEVLIDQQNQSITCVRATSDNGNIVCGSSQGSGGPGYEDGFIAKLDANGALQWKRAYGVGLVYEFLSRVIQTADGGYAAIGYSGSFNPGNTPELIVLRFNAAGGLLWSKGYPITYTEAGYDLIETSSGGFYVVGEHIAGTYSLYVIELDAYGSVLWSKIYNSAWNETPRGGALVASDGGLLIVGTAINVGGSSTHGFALKLTSGSGIEWWRSFGTIDDQETKITGAVEVPSGYLFCGYQFNGSGYDGLLVQLDQSGNHVWTKRYLGVALQSIALKHMGDGSDALVLTGEDYSTSAPDMAGLQVDMNGNTLWSYAYGTTSPSAEEAGYSVCVNSDSTITFGGWVWDSSNTPYDDGFIVRTDAEGQTAGCEIPLAISVDTTSVSVSIHSGNASVVVPTASDRLLPELNNLQMSTSCSSSPAAISEDILQARIAVFPNPATDILNITIAFSEAISVRPHVEMLDATGRTVLGPVEVTTTTQSASTAELDLDCHGLDAGAYYVRLRAGNATARSLSVLVIR
ncbi:MAG: T9SS type A sorting domain-containing protein [Flavobacteriales bacterium]|nr:MAG: T9SS type A sorting domain-containing protein [Flavobacteriales bacterium]